MAIQLIGRTEEIKTLNIALASNRPEMIAVVGRRRFQYHTKTKKHLFTSLITTFGVTENAHRLNHVDQVVVLEDLFKD